ncbi:MAG TPA: SurA N-terminal domain-containing protein [Candidatus Dormibacteraeota bacterium]|nr:SurA N-terminal domain-containing protein [Candidatus Dormibacteraeota bacterium]
MKKKWTFIVFTLFIMLALAACSSKDNNNNANGNENGNDNSNEVIDEALPEADLEGIPDVVIEINGEDITKDDFSSMYEQQFQQQAMQAQMMGQDMNDIDQDELKQQTAEIIIGQNLLIQEANNRIKDVSEDDINETIDKLLEQTGMESKDDLLAIFKEQGMDEKEFNSQIETQVKVDQLIVEISKDLEPTEEEMKETYDMIKAQQEEMESEEEFPDFDEIKSDIEMQLKEQKKAEETETLVESLREKADITIHL